MRFPGEADVSLVAPTPGLALNLMARRGVVADLAVRRVVTGHVWASRTRAVFVLEGRIAIAGGPVLKPLELALLDDAVSAAAGTDAVFAEVWGLVLPVGRGDRRVYRGSAGVLRSDDDPWSAGSLALGLDAGECFEVALVGVRQGVQVLLGRLDLGVR